MGLILVAVLALVIPAGFDKVGSRLGGWFTAGVVPAAAFLASYAPAAVNFAVGQGAFALFVVVLFNLLEPQGWVTGLVRVEDVAIGVAISVFVAALLWPRGARIEIGQSAAEALRSGSRYLGDTLAWLLGDHGRERALQDDRARGAGRRSPASATRPCARSGSATG